MKICLVSRFFDFRNAGIGRVGMEISAELTRRGHTVHIVHDGDSLYSYFFYTAIRLPLRLPKADVYHAITPMEAIWLPKRKTVVTFHDLFQITDPDKLGSGLGYSKWKNLVGRKYFNLAVNIAKRCARITAVSEKTKKDLIDYLGIPESKIHVVRSGISSDLHPFSQHEEIKTVGYLGQLDRRKRVDLLIESFRRHKNGLQLLIAGTGVDADKLKGLAGEDNRIAFLGRIPDSELSSFYGRIDALIFPTWLEGYGLPIVEAMACNRPVVVLEDAHIPDEVKNRCVIVKDLDILFGNLKYFESRCVYINTDSNCKWAKSHTWETAVDEYIDLYKELV